MALPSYTPRSVRQRAAALLACVIVLVCAGCWSFRPEPAESRPATPARPSEAEVHYVTPRQLTSSGALAATALPILTATTDRDERFTWPRPEERRPLLLVFIKAGCPCSVELEPFFHRLQRAYADVAVFVGVIDADVATARRYAEANATPYAILADAQRQLIQRLHAENGAYVALLTAAPNEATVDSLWPGCSGELVTQMGRRLAALAGVAERPLDVSGLPSAPITGCPFVP
jgi:hypothetical protein